ncbi:MAG: hypothetical protein HUJ53_02995 [Holdemanella sp.]|nr:hypothetical protein [Holdemanella sp.]
MAIVEYKCPNCTAPISFDSTVQKCKCPFCETEFDIEQIKEQVKNIDLEEKEDVQPDYYRDDGLTVYTCKSCGGEIVGDASLAATTCPFCDNNVIITSKVAGILKPDLVIPFKFNKKMAEEALINHTKGKKLLPAVFKDENHIQEIKGIYVPYWLFSSTLEGSYQFRATTTSVWSDRDYNYTKTNIYRVLRSGNLQFDNVPHDGSKLMDDTLMESIEPFLMEDAKPFDPAYLTGYYANRYDVSKEDCIPKVESRMRTSFSNEMHNSVMGYVSVAEELGNIQPIQMRTQYVFYPVWLLTTTWNGNNYTFAMNGQTGKFVGNLPLDKGLALKYFFIYFIVLALIFSAIAVGIYFIF